nr:IS5 family transposase [Pseudoroseomonas vastitatis]
MWTPQNRPKYDRSKLRYPSDLTDEEWSIIAPLIPRAKRGGNKRTVDERAVVNGVMYILSTGCQWAALPKDLPPRSTVNDYLRRWAADRTLDRIHHALYVLCREQVGREASPTAAIIDSQSVRGAETYGPPRRQAVSEIWRRQSASTYPVSGSSPGQDGDPRVPSLIKGPASSAIFEIFRPVLNAALARSDRSRGGRPPYDVVLMFRILVLQALYSLSDEQAEF